VLFHLRFLELSGHAPELAFCLVCKKALDEIGHVRFLFDIRQGGLICPDCGKPSLLRIPLAKGTLKQLLWFQKTEPGKTSVMRFSRRSLSESLEFLERFLGYHLEKELGSLKFLNRIRTTDDMQS
jgi:DNA repair protein RecO (recombination protein O)